MLSVIGVSFVQADDFSGVVSSVSTRNGRQIVLFRTGTEDIEFELASQTPQTRTLLLSARAKEKITPVSIPAGTILSRRSVPMNVRSDCSELPLGINELDQIANRSTDFIDFLRNIPEGSLQVFTFVYNSKSIQRGKFAHGKVSPKWPRVLRTSKDGKLTMSYVCNPRNPTYGKIELLHFDDATKEFKTAEYDFNKPRRGQDTQRIVRNPTTCVSCHGGSSFGGTPSLKPVWPEYFQWGDCERKRGISLYGSNDDNMDPNRFRARIQSTADKVPDSCDTEADRKAHVKETELFAKFKKKHEDNPCYNLLPWAENPDEPHKYYPYAINSQTRDENGFFRYEARTNARMTDMYGHLMGQRVTQLLKKSPEYDLAKYYIALEGADCSLTSGEESELASLLDGFTIQRMQRTANSVLPQRDPRLSAPFLYSFAKRVGLSDEDWSMELKRTGDPAYSAVMFRGRLGTPNGGNDLAVHDVVAGEVLIELQSENPVLKEADPAPLTRGITDVFGPRFSCIDDLGGGIKNALRGTDGAFCGVLRAEKDKYIQARARRNSSRSSGDLQSARMPTPEGIASRGKSLVQSNCTECHSATRENVRRFPESLIFLPSSFLSRDRNDIAIQKLRERKANGFMEVLNRRLIVDRDMPPEGDDLTSEDRENIRSYIRSL